MLIAGFRQGFYLMGYGLYPPIEKNPCLNVLSGCSQNLLSRERQWQTLKDEDHIVRITSIKFESWTDLEIKAAPRYGNSGIAQNRYSAQTFIYLR